MTTTAASRASHLRDEAAYMVCGLWMIVGLYIDGWSHQADKPETFLTPWHAILYSGFGAAIAYSAYIGRRDARLGRSPAIGEDRVTTLGVAIFALGAGGDFAWHELIGIEVDIEGLVSPTHLMLMIGGLLMVTLPVRSALRDQALRMAPLPVVASMALALGVTTFFLMYLVPWSHYEIYGVAYVPDIDEGDLRVAVGMAQVIVTTALLVGTMLWAARRWAVPFGMATITFTAIAIGQSGLEGFDVRLPILAATGAGVVADVLVAQRRSFHLTGALTGGALWATFFALHHLETGVEWSPSLWVGAIVFAALTGLATGVAVRER